MRIIPFLSLFVSLAFTSTLAEYKWLSAGVGVGGYDDGVLIEWIHIQDGSTLQICDVNGSRYLFAETEANGLLRKDVLAIALAAKASGNKVNLLWDENGSGMKKFISIIATGK